MEFKFVKTNKDAVTPSRANATDSGWDLYLVSLIKQENGVYFYDTGIAVESPPGYYLELVGRSSISKTGYMLANNIGIIDNGYRGNIIAALVKINSNANDIQLPARLVQIIPKKITQSNFVEVNDLNQTPRGTGGFGSSGTN